MKTILYARVSRDDLDCENQKKVLLEWAKRNDVTDYEYFKEEVSSRKTRPEKEKVIKLFREGVVGTIVVTRIDRFARSLTELIMDIENVINQGGRFVAIMNSFDFDKKNYNASQQLMLNIFASFAQFERELIRERTLEGLARVKAQGKKLGRPRKTPPVKLDRIIEDTINPEQTHDLPKKKSLKEQIKGIGNEIKEELSKVADDLKLNFSGG